jgi:hypothetical protein
MHIDHRNPRVRRGFAFVALAAVLGLSAVGLTQCRLVDDTVTGVDVRSNSGFLNAVSDCVHQCNEKFKACQKAEEARHKAALRACGDAACKKAENKLHKDNQKNCVRSMQLCKRNCHYNEGAGSSGR